MIDFSKFTKEDSKEIIEFCFKNANKLPQISTLEDWIHAFLTMLESECWSKAMDDKESEAEEEKKRTRANKGCSCFAQAQEVANRSRALRESRFYNYMKEIVETHDTEKLPILAVKHNSIAITKEEYAQLGIYERENITRDETDAIYMWKFAKDGQFERERVLKYRKALEDLGFNF